MRLRTCKARDCEEKFEPRPKTQQYHSRTCKNREAQRRLRKRQKVTA